MLIYDLGDLLSFYVAYKDEIDWATPFDKPVDVQILHDTNSWIKLIITEKPIIDLQANE